MTFDNVTLTIGGKEVRVTSFELTYDNDGAFPNVTVEGALTNREAKKPEPQCVGVDCAAEGADRSVYTHHYGIGKHRQMSAEMILTVTPEGNDYFKKMYMCDWKYNNEEKVKEEENMRDDRCEEKASCEDSGYYGGEHLSQKIKDLELDAEQRKLLKYNLVGRNGLITNRGKEVLLNHLLAVYGEDIVKDLEALEEAEKPQVEN